MLERTVKGGVLPTGRLLLLSLILLFLSFCAGTPRVEKSNVCFGVKPTLYIFLFCSNLDRIAEGRYNILPGQFYSPIFPPDTLTPNFIFSGWTRNPFPMGVLSPLLSSQLLKKLFQNQPNPALNSPSFKSDSSFLFNHTTVQMEIKKIIYNGLASRRLKSLHDFTSISTIYHFIQGFHFIAAADKKDSFHKFTI